MANETVSQQRGAAEDQAMKPPIPKFLYKIVNPTMGLLLRSPLHGRLSRNLMLLSFKGRTSGKSYTIPVGYVQNGDHVWVFSHSHWWKNLRGGVPVTLHL